MSHHPPYQRFNPVYYPHAEHGVTGHGPQPVIPQGYELAGVPEFTDSNGRVVIPILYQPGKKEYYDAWRDYCLWTISNAPSAARHHLRQLVECAIDCPSECAYAVGEVCNSVVQGATAPP